MATCEGLVDYKINQNASKENPNKQTRRELHY